MYSNAQRYVKLGDVYFNKYNIETFTKIDDQDNNKYELHIHTVYGKNYDFILTSHKELINKIGKDTRTASCAKKIFIFILISLVSSVFSAGFPENFL